MWLVGTLNWCWIWWSLEIGSVTCTSFCFMVNPLQEPTVSTSCTWSDGVPLPYWHPNASPSTSSDGVQHLTGIHYRSWLYPHPVPDLIECRILVGIQMQVHPHPQTEYNIWQASITGADCIHILCIVLDMMECCILLGICYCSWLYLHHVVDQREYIILYRSWQYLHHVPDHWECSILTGIHYRSRLYPHPVHCTWYDGVLHPSRHLLLELTEHILSNSYWSEGVHHPYRHPLQVLTVSTSCTWSEGVHHPLQELTVSTSCTWSLGVQHPDRHPLQEPTKSFTWSEGVQHPLQELTVSTSCTWS
jgi:hypothetical protein